MTIKSVLNRFAVGFMTAAVVAMGSFSAFAESADNSKPDLEAKNSVTITLKSADGSKLVSGAEFGLYKVADITYDDGDLVYSPLGGYDVSEITESNLTDTAFVSALEKKAANAVASGSTSADGTVKFSDLDSGLYLLVNTKSADGYEKINSFLVTAPTKVDGVWVNDVDAAPKMEAAVEKSPTPTPTATPPATIPQTGQLNWPIPVLAVSGLVLFSVGLLLKKSRNNDKA